MTQKKIWLLSLVFLAALCGFAIAYLLPGADGSDDTARHSGAGGAGAGIAIIAILAAKRRRKNKDQHNG
ncbi:MAG: hypothetical protein WAT93_02720 [Pontixanthobacter sp.]